MKKFTALALALVMVLSLGVTASAATGSGGGYSGSIQGTPYAVEGGNIYISSWGAIVDADEGITSAVIPAEIDGIAVTSLESYALGGCPSLTSITLPASLTDIGPDHPFSSCSSLVEIIVDEANTAYCSVDGVLFNEEKTTLVQYPIGRTDTSYVVPSGVTSIGSIAFSECISLTSITIPEGVMLIGGRAFRNCTSLESVTIPSSVTSISGQVFWGCTSLKSVTIPSSVTEIGLDVFSGCDSLTDVYYGGSEAEWNVIDVDDWGNDPLLNATIHYGKPSPSPTAYASTQVVDIDGKAVELQAYALKDENGNPTNYVKLRDVAHVLSGTAAQFEVAWDGAVNIITGSPYTPNGSEMKTPFSGDRAYTVPTAVTNINGTPAALDAIKLTDDNGGGYTYYKLRDLGRALGFNVSWSAERGIYLETDKPYTEDDASGETETDSNTTEAEKTDEATVLDATSLDVIGVLKLVEEFVKTQGGEMRINIGWVTDVSRYYDKLDFVQRYLENSPAVVEFNCGWEKGNIIAVGITEYAEVDADTDYTVYYDTYLDENGFIWVENEMGRWYLNVGGEGIYAFHINSIPIETGANSVEEMATYWYSSIRYGKVSASDQTAEDIAPRPMIP